MFSHCPREIYESSKNDPVLIDRRFLQVLNGHSQIRPSTTFLSRKTISVLHWHRCLDASKPRTTRNVKMACTLWINEKIFLFLECNVLIQQAFLTGTWPTYYRHAANCRPTNSGKISRKTVNDSWPTVGRQFFGELFFTFSQTWEVSTLKKPHRATFKTFTIMTIIPFARQNISSLLFLSVNSCELMSKIHALTFLYTFVLC